MLKRLIYVALAAIAGWAIWRRIQDMPGDQHAPTNYQPLAPSPPAPIVPVAPAPPATQVTREPPPTTDTIEPPVPAEPTVEPEGLTIEAYCVRCKERRTIEGAREEITASHRRGARGVCPVCGGNVFTFLPSREH